MNIQAVLRIQWYSTPQGSGKKLLIDCLFHKVDRNTRNIELNVWQL